MTDDDSLDADFRSQSRNRRQPGEFRRRRTVVRILRAASAAAFALAVASCGSASSTPSSPATTAAAHPSTAAALPFGTPATVEGGNGAYLTVTPVAAWWLTSDGSGPGATHPSLGRFLIIELKLSPVSSPATFPVPLTGDGPSIISGGRIISDAGDNASNNVVWNTCLPAVDSSVTMQPGDTLTDGETYDVPAQSGELRWTNANGTEVSWRLPTKDTGPLPANVQGAISSGNGC